VLNVLTGERYKSIAKETAGVLKGEYGATPAPVNKNPARPGAERRATNHLPPGRPDRAGNGQTDRRRAAKSQGRGVKLAAHIEEDALINGLFAQVGWKFLVNRGNPAAF